MVLSQMEIKDNMRTLKGEFRYMKDLVEKKTKELNTIHTEIVDAKSILKSIESRYCDLESQIDQNIVND